MRRLSLQFKPRIGNTVKPNELLLSMSHLMFGYNPQLLIKHGNSPIQLTDFLNGSDHIAFQWEKIVTLNLMMQCRGVHILNPNGAATIKYNNGFGKEFESESEYESRVKKLLGDLSSSIEKHNNTKHKNFSGYFLFQEAMIKPTQIEMIQEELRKKFPKVKLLSTTDWGVMTLSIDGKPLSNDTKMNEILGKLKLDSRFQTFIVDNEKQYKLSNIHCPHATDDKGFRENLTKILNPALEQLLENMPAGSNLDVKFESSPEGHLKDKGTRTISVDGVLSLRLVDASGNILKRHDIAGDFNNTPENIEICLREIFEKIAEKHAIKPIFERVSTGIFNYVAGAIVAFSAYLDLTADAMLADEALLAVARRAAAL